MQSILNQLSEKINYLRRREIEGILHILLQNPGISNNKLVQTVGIPKETLRSFKSDAGFILKNAQIDSIYIREDLIAQLKTENPREYVWPLIDLSDSALSEKIKKIRHEYKLIPKRELDQFYASPETTIAKALIMEKKGVLDNSHVAVLGDDDLVSVALAILTTMAKSVIVFDVDTALIAAIKGILAGLGTKNTQVEAYDAVKELNPKYKGNFDVVVIDPPYNKTGVTLFLNRAIEMIGEEVPDKYIFMYFGTSPKTPEKTLKVQQIIDQTGLVIEDKFDHFARYEGAESIGSTSSLYILKTTLHTRPVVQHVDYSQMYTFQHSKEERFPYVDHVVFKVYNVPSSVIRSKSALLKALGEFCRLHKLKVVDDKVTPFGKSGGLTITYVLASSNLVVHTWPELGALHFDLITCSPIYNKSRLVESLQRLFAAKQVEMKVIE